MKMKIFKISMVLMVLVLTVMMLGSCNSWTNSIKHFQSSTTGIKRTIVTIPPGMNPRVIETTSYVEYNGGMVQFIDNQGHTHSWPCNYTWIDEKD
jgi:hypothetical protein